MQRHSNNKMVKNDDNNSCKTKSKANIFRIVLLKWVFRLIKTEIKFTISVSYQPFMTSLPISKINHKDSR